MKKFKTISDYEILKIVWNDTIEQYEYESNRLKEDPDFEIYINRTREVKARLDEIREALSAIERKEWDKLARVATQN